jgi:hypothetical protein
VSNTRIFWIIWCTMWAVGWLLIGFFTFLLGWIMVPPSLLAILLPVGRADSGPAPQVVYPPAYPPPAGWVPHGLRPTGGPRLGPGDPRNAAP